ncbi:methyltransferase domain-containing protein [Actinomycetes bacterium KLBMP 9759]
MTSIVNTAQSDAWNGYEGGHWAANADRYDAVNSGFNTFVLDAATIGADDRVLDIGCGNGQLTRLAARAARTAHGVDLSVPMLDTARGRALHEGLDNVTFEAGDVQVHPFPAEGFDVAVSRFAVMFFSDPVAAFGNVHRALRPGGRLAFVCMTSLADTDLGDVLAAMTPHLRTVGAEPDEPATAGPESFADPERVGAILDAAGFAGIACVKVEADQIWGRDTADAAGFLASWGPVRHQLGLVDADAAGRAVDALAESMSRFASPDAVRLRGSAWLVTATASR